MPFLGTPRTVLPISLIRSEAISLVTWNTQGSQPLWLLHSGLNEQVLEKELLISWGQFCSEWGFPAPTPLESLSFLPSISSLANKNTLLLFGRNSFSTYTEPSDKRNNSWLLRKRDFPGGTRGKEPAYQCRGPRFDPWVRKIPWRRKGQPTPVLLPGESHGQRSLVGYSSWDHRVGHDSSDLAQMHPL